MSHAVHSAAALLPPPIAPLLACPSQASRKHGTSISANPCANPLQVSLYGLIKIQSFYLPFAFACITLLMGQSVVPDLAGIAVGHVYYFLKDVYPVQAGKQVLVCPNFIKQWLADMGVRGAAPPPREAQGVPQGFQAFRGSGRRLGS